MRTGFDRVRLGDLDGKDDPRSLSRYWSSTGPWHARRSPGLGHRACVPGIQGKTKTEVSSTGRYIASKTGEYNATSAMRSPQSGTPSPSAVRMPAAACQSTEDNSHLGAWSCYCGRVFTSERGMKIHRTKKGCFEKQAICTSVPQATTCILPQTRCSVNEARTVSELPPLEAKQCDANGAAHSSHRKQSLWSTKQPINWPEMKEHARWRELDILASDKIEGLSGGLAWRAARFSEIVYDTCWECFGPVTRKTTKSEAYPNRRMVRKKQLRKQLRALKRRRVQCSSSERSQLDVLMKEIRQKIARIAKAEARRKHRQERRRNTARFMKDPYTYARGLFEASKSGELKAPKEEVEEHLRRTYGGSDAANSLGEFPGSKRPTEPGYAFYSGPITKFEVDDVVAKARAKSAPGMNRISYKVYKMCPRIRGLLAELLDMIWARGIIPDEWCKADGVYIPKEDHSESISQFRPISLLNVEGKIFFSILSRRLTRFIVSNGYINYSVQKAGIPGHPGCVEHATMIWSSIKQARRERADLSVVWLDLANAYGSVPHKAILAALRHFWVPNKVIDIINLYYNKFQMRFTTRQYTTAWQPLKVGIPMGCAISPLLFVIAMEMVMRSVSHLARGVALAPNQHLPPMLAYMDDITLVIPSRAEVAHVLRGLDQLFTWCCMKFKPAKCRSLTLSKGRVTAHKFNVGGETIPLLSEQPVKSLGRWYAMPLNDRCRSKEITSFVLRSLSSIEKSNLPGKYKAWCYQFGLLPRVSWQLTVYDVPLSPVEQMERKISSRLRKWLGVPRSFATNALYANSFKLCLPFKSLVEEYKACKIRTQAMLQFSRDETMRNMCPDLDTGKKWTVRSVMESLLERLAMKDMIGATAQGRSGLGLCTFERFADAKGQRKWAMVVEELRAAEEERRLAIAAQQSQQGRWMGWESTESRSITWSDLWTWDPGHVSFILRSTYDQLPIPANLYRWRKRDSSACPLCHGGICNLKHILAGCAANLGM